MDWFLPGDNKKPGERRAFPLATFGGIGLCAPCSEDYAFFEELLLDDFRAEDFPDDFFAPLLELERDALDFFAPDFELPDLDLEALLVELFLLVAGDLAIADILSFPSKKGTGIASPAVVKKPPSDGSRLIARKCS